MLTDSKCHHSYRKTDEVREKYRDRLECQHLDSSRIVRKSIANGSAYQYRYQCLTCGWAHGGAIAKKEACRLTEPPDYDPSLKHWYAEYQQELEHAKTLEISNREQKIGEWWDWYNEYLKSPGWKKRRAKVLMRAAGKCEGCLDRPPSEVHHLSYAHAGNELLFELVALCDQCHAIAHGDDE